MLEGGPGLGERVAGRKEEAGKEGGWWGSRGGGVGGT